MMLLICTMTGTFEARVYRQTVMHMLQPCVSIRQYRGKRYSDSSCAHLISSSDSDISSAWLAVCVSVINLLWIMRRAVRWLDGQPRYHPSNCDDSHYVRLRIWRTSRRSPSLLCVFLFACFYCAAMWFRNTFRQFKFSVISLWQFRRSQRQAKNFGISRALKAKFRT